jgi:hypothetical protein
MVWRKPAFGVSRFPRISLPDLPGSLEFMAIYQEAMAGIAPARPSRHGAGTLGNLVTDFYRSAEFANLKPSSQAVYRVVLGTLVEAHGHRLVRDLPTAKARKIIEEIGAESTGHGKFNSVRFSPSYGLRSIDRPAQRQPVNGSSALSARNPPHMD